MFPKPTPEEILLETLIFGNTSRAITNQEKRGQADLSTFDVLPKKCLGSTTRADLESLGIVFGADADDLFIQAKLPPGWKKRPTSHDMWIDLLDDQGRKRAGIFYKAAFYDRRAHIGLDCRYSSHLEPVTGWDEPFDDTCDWIGTVKDGDTIIWRTEAVATFDNHKAKDDLEKQARLWLEEHYPDYRNPVAYWK